MPTPKGASRSTARPPSQTRRTRSIPSDTPGRIKAAWAYIRQPVNAGKYTDEEVRTIKIRIRRAAEAREVALPDPDDFVALMHWVRKKKGKE